ncbi:MAG: restriction endonuclease, partial [Flavobacterium sp.]
KMDEKPFLEFDITNLKDNVISEIVKFHKSNFDVNKIVNNASLLKYTTEIKKQIDNELQNPSNEFVKLFANKVYPGRLTEKVVDEFKDLVQKGFNQFISEKINDRLNAAINKETQKQKEEAEEVIIIDDNKIFTSEEEMEGTELLLQY